MGRLVRRSDRLGEDMEAFFQSVLHRHSRIAGYERTGVGEYCVYRERGDVVKVYLSNIYLIGIADYLDIHGECPDVE